MLSKRQQANVINRHEIFDSFARSEKGQIILLNTEYTPEGLDVGNALVETYRTIREQYNAAKGIEMGYRSDRDINHEDAELGMRALRNLISRCFVDRLDVLTQFGLNPQYQTILTPTTTSSEEESSEMEGEESETDLPVDPIQGEGPDLQGAPGSILNRSLRRRIRYDIISQKLVEWPEFLENLKGVGESERMMLTTKGLTDEFLLERLVWLALENSSWPRPA